MKRLSFVIAIVLTVSAILLPLKYAIAADAGDVYHFICDKAGIETYTLVYYHLIYIGGDVGSISKFDPATGDPNDAVSWANAGIDMTLDTDFKIAAGSLDKQLPNGDWLCRVFGSSDATKDNTDTKLGSVLFTVSNDVTYDGKKGENKKIIRVTTDY